MSEEAEVLERKIEHVLSEKAGVQVRVRGVWPLAGGTSQDSHVVDVTFRAGALAGDRRLLLRSDGQRPRPWSMSRKEEFEVARAAAERGVRTPMPRWLTRGLIRDGAWAYFMDWVDGEALGLRVVSDPLLASAREKLADELAAQLACIHSVTRAAAPALGALPLNPGPRGAAAAALARVRRLVDQLSEPHPAMELCLRWLSDHAPPPQEPTLTHGDFRTGNFLVTPAGLSAVLDWELAHFGDPMEDLGWLCIRDWRFGQLALPAGGVARRAALYDAYERCSGRAVEPRRIHYWEVLGNIRRAAASLHQGERHLTGERPDIERVATAHRVAEMEFEAIRLIEKGA